MLATEPIGVIPMSAMPDLRQVIDIAVDTSWSVLNGNALSTTYKIYNNFEIDTAFSILKAVEKNTSWLISNSKSLGTSYSIYQLTTVETAWNIVKLKETDSSWNILNGKDIPTTYKIFTLNSNDTSWPIGLDNPVLDTEVFNAISQAIEFSGEEITILFDEENTTIIFV